ncbi:ABC transporter substrate-binding protein [Corynebacterium freiburgense]|uniref:ABC transporter substrate-binding protein n=1 Tax=Corynebacterium freiburgense TaxID=556548 RepID=UPI00041F4A64|nr:ABC transporter substrate-binding protein [Corynebacterium freiburgense]WJZ03332.1 Glutathione-binding protein GsiB precursor [Corynebacterium freiburgense]
MGKFQAPNATLSVIAAATVTATLSACSAGSTAARVGRIADENTVVVAVAAAPASLDFTKTSGAAIPQALMGNVYEGLVKINDEGEVEPLLATDWEVSSDRLTYTFHLQKGVTFSNGSPFNAETAKFSIDRVRSEEWTNGLKKQMDVVSETRVVDPHTLEVTLTRPSNRWLWSMGTFIGAMMSPDGVSELATNPIGTGPYTIDQWAVGQSLSFAARSDYWGNKPANNGAAIRYFSDAIGATNALRSGDVDVVYSMQSPELLQTLDSYQVKEGTTNGEVLLSMNNRREPFNDVRVRQAVLYAIDRQAVIDTAWAGKGIDTGGVPVPPSDPWYEESDRYPFNPDKARELIKEAGAEGKRIVLSVPSLPYATAASEIVVSQLRDVGLDVVIESTEFPAVWLSKVHKAHDYDMSIIMHIEARDIPTLFGNPDYYLGFDSETVRQALELADSDSPDNQVTHMRRAVDGIMEEAGAATLFNYPNIVVSSPNVDGVRANLVAEGLQLSTLRKEQ